MEQKNSFKAWISRKSTIVCLVIYLIMALALVPTVEYAQKGTNVRLSDILSFYAWAGLDYDYEVEMSRIDAASINHLEYLDDGSYAVQGEDPYILLDNINKKVCSVTVKISEIQSMPSPSNGVLYFATDSVFFSEEMHIEALKTDGGYFTFILPVNARISAIRIDMGEPGQAFCIENVMLNRRDAASVFVSWWVVCVAAALFLLLSVLNYFYPKMSHWAQRNRFSCERQLLVIGTVFGVAMALMLPIQQAPDEYVHIVRSFGLSKGVAFGSGGEYTAYLPESIENFYFENELKNIALNGKARVDTQRYFDLLDMPLEAEKTKSYTDYRTTKSYLFTSYIPQAAGMLVGQLLNLPVFYVLTLGRLFNLAAYLAVCWAALKIMPIKKDLLLIIMLLPISVQQAASISPDAMLISVSMLLVAYVLKILMSEEDIPLRSVAAICGMALLMASIKLPYVLLGGAVFALPLRRFTVNFGARRVRYGKWATERKWPVIAALAALVLIAAAAVLAIKSNTVILGNVGAMISKPKILIYNIVYSFYIKWNFYLESMVGYLGWVRELLPDSLIYGILIYMLIIALKKEDDIYSVSKLPIRLRVIFGALGICMAAVMALVGLAWAGDEPVKGLIAQGVQGRYFIPFIALLLLPLGGVIRSKAIGSAGFRMLYLAAVPVMTIAQLIVSYWG